METKELPFAKEFITDSKGHITKIRAHYQNNYEF